jgi:hypothetical protein
MRIRIQSKQFETNTDPVLKMIPTKNIFIFLSRKYMKTKHFKFYQMT